jgi:hypothetical protein
VDVAVSPGVFKNYWPDMAIKSGGFQEGMGYSSESGH